MGNVLDDIERRHESGWLGAVRIGRGDFDTLLRLARLAERMSDVPTIPVWDNATREIRSILHPSAPAKGVVNAPHSPWDCIRFWIIRHGEPTVGFNWVELDGVRFYVGFCAECEAKASKGIEPKHIYTPPAAPTTGEVKGALVWLPAGSRYTLSENAVYLASGMTLHEAQRGFSVDGEREWAAKDAEIARLRGALERIAAPFAQNPSLGNREWLLEQWANHMERIARDALGGR